MLIYRVENEKRWGPYGASHSDIPGWSTMASADVHPMPQFDGALADCAKFRPSDPFGILPAVIRHSRKEWGEVRFGFASLDQYKAWFFRPLWRSAFKRKGFRIVVYDAAIALAGDHQAVFSLQGAHSVKRVLDMETLEPVQELENA